MSRAMHEISEAGHRILNPYSDAKLMLLGAVCRVGAETRLLDLACGKGELLCRWAQEFGVRGHGVDISEVFLPAAAERAWELGVQHLVTFEAGDAGAPRAERAAYDVVSCLGATWIGGGLVGTIELMRPLVRPGGLLLVGEPFWTDPPPAEAYEAFDVEPDEFASLPGLLERFESAGADVVEMVLADGDDWDRYAAAQWWTLTEWLRDHRGDERWADVRAFRNRSRHEHLAYQRRYLGWGVFVLRPELT